MNPICRTSFSYSIIRPPSFDLSLYLVANRPSYPDENLFISKIMGAVKGGVSVVQLRDHKSDFVTTLRTASRLKKMLKDVPLFINTLRPFEVMQAVGADGVYLEENFPHSEVRKLLGRNVIIGIPVKTIEEVLSLEHSSDIDYLSVKILPSKRTCPRNDQLWGIEGLQEVRAISPHRIVAIGGLNLECVESVYRELYLSDGIAMAGGLMEENDPCITAQKIRAIHRRVGGRS